MSLSKKHHFVAQSILKRFTDKSDHFWYFHPNDKRGVCKVKPDSVFFIKHENSLLLVNGEKDDILEKIYGELDSDWSVLTEEINLSLSKKQTPVLDQESQDALFELLYRQMWRSPDLLTDGVTSDIFSSSMKQVREEFPVEEVRKFETDPDLKAKIMNNSKILARGAEFSSDVAEFFRKFEPVIISVSKKATPFIIGSQVKTASSGYTILPIAPRTAIALQPKTTGTPAIKKINCFNDVLVKKANIEMAKKSRYGICGIDEQSIRKLSRYCKEK